MKICIRESKDIIQLVEQDQWMMDVLEKVKSLDLPDWWICAGFVRSKIWDTLHGYNKRTPIPDIDVIYFDKINIDEDEEKRLERKLKFLLPNLPWSVKNEARMHIANDIPPYESSVDAIAKFPETATAIGIKLDSNSTIILVAPHGIQDLINLEIRPTPYFLGERKQGCLYEKRIVEKNWKSKWNNIKIVPY